MIILCNGMIRSGSTLQFNIVKSLFNELSMNFTNLGFYSEVDLLNHKDELEKYAGEKSIYLLKTHDHSFLNSLDNVYVIYSYREVLDVAGSIKRKFNASNSELYNSLKKCKYNHDNIIEGSNFLLVQEYEKMISMLLISVQQIMLFLKLDLDENKIQQVANRNSPENTIKLQNRNSNMKKIKSLIFNFLSRQDTSIKNSIKNLMGEKYFNLIKVKLFPHDNSTLLHLDHVSSNLGQNGNWVNILDEDEINYIKTHFPSWD